MITHRHIVQLCMLLLFASTVGCQQFMDAITNPELKKNLKLDIADGVGTYIVLEPSKTDERAKRVIEVAQTIKNYAQTDLTTSDVRRVITNAEIRRYTAVDDRLRARFLVNLLFHRAQRHFGIDFNVVPAESLPETRKFIIEMCDAAIESAQEYLDPPLSRSVDPPFRPGKTVGLARL